MPQHLKSCLLLLVLFLAQAQMAAAQIADAPFYAELDSLSSGQKLDTAFAYLEDKSSEQRFEQIFARPTSDWKKLNQSSMSFGYTDSNYWFRLVLNNSTDKAHKRILEIAYPVLDYIDIYQRSADGSWQIRNMGDKLPFAQREFAHRFFLVPIELAPESSLDIIIKVKTSSSMQFPVRIWTEKDFFEHDQNQIMASGIYYGIMLVMVLYNFFIFFAVREKNYLYYVIYVAFLALFLASLQGLNFQYFWPNATTWNDISIVVFLGAAILFGMLFTFNFLQINGIEWFKRIRVMIIITLLSMILASAVVSYHHTIRMLIVVAVFCVMLAMVVGIVRWQQGHTSARYYVIAWTTMLVGGIIMALNKFDVIPRNFFTENVVQFGSAIEVILLSFALADRLNQEKRKRYEAQHLALSNERLARTAQTDAFEAQKRANETLEQRVKERTLELEEVNKQLEFMSITDPLTNIRNRRYFDKTMQIEMARAIREQEPISVLIVDIDYFKQVNDGYGHQTGDEVLKTIAATLSQLVHRSTDLLARFGGEEFVLILPNTTMDGASHVAECIRTAIAELEFEALAKGLKLTVSIGVYGAVPQANSNYEKWVSHADDALYYAKNHGRNRVVSYSKEQLDLS